MPCTSCIISTLNVPLCVCISFWVSVILMRFPELHEYASFDRNVTSPLGFMDYKSYRTIIPKFNFFLMKALIFHWTNHKLYFKMNLIMKSEPKYKTADNILIYIFSVNSIQEKQLTKLGNKSLKLHQ